jgi:hypothetical protein
LRREEGDHQLRTHLLALSTTTLLAGPALAQGVPVNDAQRLSQEAGIANCMQKAAAASGSRVSPSQGTTRSLTTPGTAGQFAQVGTNVVSGSAVDASGPALSSKTSSIGGFDFGALLQVANGIDSLKTGNFAQVLNAANLVATALPNDTSTLEQVQTAIGSAQGEQAAFDQNTGARIASASVWNQAIETANNRLKLQTMRLNDRITGQAATARVMRFTHPGPASTGASATAGTPDNVISNKAN